MSIGLSQALSNARSSINVRQQELNVVSNNIAKADQTGYHRQKVQVSDNATILVNEGYFGTGVHVSTITRVYDAELENSLSLSMNTDGYNQTYADILSQVEKLLAPKGDAQLTDVVSAFMSAMQDLADAPEENSYRSALITSASNMATAFNQEYENLRKIRDNIAYSKNAADPYAVGGDVVDRTDDINAMLDDMVELNNQISRLESNAFLNQTANDLRDQRDQLVKDISKYAKITVTETADAKYHVTIHDDGSGTDLILVDGTAGTPSPDASHIVPSLTGVTPPGNLEFEVYDPNAATYTSLTLESESGEISALYEGRESYVKGQMTQLYSFAQAITQTVNTRLALGEDLDGNAGSAMFTVIGAQPASGSIMSVTAITPRQIAASDVDPTIVGADIEQGNGANMSALWSDFNSTIAIGAENNSISGYSNDFIAKIAQDTATFASFAETSSNAVTMFQDAISSQSGVDSDQEMVSMLEIQRAYQAAGKLIAAIESMYDSLFAIR